MKKRFLCMLLSAVLVLSIGACSNNATEEHGHEHVHEYENEVAATESLRKAEVVLEIGTVFPNDDVHYQSLQSFAEEVLDRTDGAIAVEIHNLEKTGTDREIIREMSENHSNVDIIVSNAKNFVEMDARMDIASLPFCFGNYEEAWRFMDGEIQTEIEKNLIDKNIRVLAHYSGGFGAVISSGKAVGEVSDLQNLRLMVEEESNLAVTMRGLGAQVTVLDKNTISQELQQEKTDGYFGKLTDIYENSYYLMKDQLSLTFHQYEGIVFAIAEDVWASLSEEQQKIVSEAAFHSSQIDRENVRQQENDMIQRMQAAGIFVQYTNTESFKESVQPIIRGLYTQYGNLIDRVITQNYMK